MSFNKEDLLVNIKRQAKRLSKLLSISLGQAQEALAICVYGCDDYSQLIAYLKSSNFENQRLALTALSPHSDLFLLKLLQSDMSIILNNFEKKFPDENLTEEDLVSLFGLNFSEFNLKISN